MSAQSMRSVQERERSEGPATGGGTHRQRDGETERQRQAQRETGRDDGFPAAIRTARVILWA